MSWPCSSFTLTLFALAGTASTSAAARHHDNDSVQKAVNSGMGFIVGDILAQRLTGEAFDAVRSLELGLYGTLLGEPAESVFLFSLV